MAKGARKPKFDEDWFDEIDEEIVDCNKQDLQKIKCAQKKEYKNKRAKQRKQAGELSYYW